MKSAIAMIALVALVRPAIAQTVDIDKLSKADLEKLSPDQVKSLPFLKYMARAQKPEEHAMLAIFRAMLPLQLRDLGYGFREAFTGSDEQIESWSKEFHAISASL